MRPRDRERAQQLETAMLAFDDEKRALLGIRNSANRATFIEQVLESIRRVKYVSVLSKRKLSDRFSDPNDELFDPLKAAIVHHRKGQVEEAFWLVFLFVHFGKHAKAGWRYAREVYGRLGDARRWDWISTSSNPSEFRAWLDAHQCELKRSGFPHGFGNHRKYESLDAYSAKGTGSVIESYVRWVSPPRTHMELIEQALERASGDPWKTFDKLYRSMRTVTRFGRLARFDYLTMIGKLGLASIEPGSTYMKNSTGPAIGARRLFSDQPTAPISPTELDQWLVELDSYLKVGMQVLEDALCNWQKSPGKFRAFRG